MYRDGFIAEAQITGQLEHQYIVPVHELGTDENGHHYFSMKLIEGGSLREALEALPCSIRFHKVPKTTALSTSASGAPSSPTAYLPIA